MWNTFTSVEKAGTYRFQLDENWFTLDANLLREALEITPIDQAHPFVSPPSGDAIMDFVNELGYPEVIHFVSSMAVNNMYQPWRTILSMINQYNMADKNVPALAPIRSDEQILPFAAWVPIGCMGDLLTYNTADKNVPALATQYVHDETDTFPICCIMEITPIDQAHQFMSHPLGDAIMDFVNELRKDFWEEFVQAIQTFLTDKENLGSPTKKGRKDKPYVILYCRFTKLIICHLGRTHNIHQRSTSSFHLAEEDFRLGNLKFVLKCEVNEVFGMPIPNELISNNIRNAPYYNAYLEMVAKHDQMVAAEKEGKKKTEKPSKPSTAKPPKTKPAKEKSTKATPLQMASKDKVAKAQSQAHVGGLAIREPVAKATRLLPVVEGKGKAIVTKEQVAQSLLALHTLKRRSTTDQFILQGRASTTEEASTGPSVQPLDDTSANIVHDSSCSANAETGARSDKTNSGGDTKILQITKDLGEDVDKMENVEEKTIRTQDGPDRNDAGWLLLDQILKPTHDEFMPDLYPKNLKDAYAIGDQFINDKSTDDEPGKLNVEAEVVSMVTVPIYQASSSVPPLSTPVIDLPPPKPASSTTQAPIFTAATTTTTTTLPPPLQQ
ncbi:hypothetical protein Tco_0079394 [Tanacetum coccineum]